MSTPFVCPPGRCADDFQAFLRVFAGLFHFIDFHYFSPLFIIAAISFHIFHSPKPCASRRPIPNVRDARHKTMRAVRRHARPFTRCRPRGKRDITTPSDSPRAIMPDCHARARRATRVQAANFAIITPLAMMRAGVIAHAMQPVRARISLRDTRGTLCR